jgi:hypothetical protein
VVPDFFCFGIGKVLPCWGRKGERQNMPKKNSQMAGKTLASWGRKGERQGKPIRKIFPDLPELSQPAGGEEVKEVKACE